jgi:hypothetical protein
VDDDVGVALLDGVTDVEGSLEEAPQAVRTKINNEVSVIFFIVFSFFS